MSAFNTVTATIHCPRCGQPRPTPFECEFGYVAEMVHVTVGERYPRAYDNAEGDGYGECPACRCDYFVRVQLHAGIVVSVVADYSRFPLGPDAVIPSLKGYCQRCSSEQDLEVRLYAGCTRSIQMTVGSPYLPRGMPDITTTLWAQGLCVQMHESVLLVSIVSSVLRNVESTTIDRWVRPSELGRKRLAAGPMFLESGRSEDAG